MITTMLHQFNPIIQMLIVRLINYLIWSNQIHHMTADRQNKPITTYRPGPTQTGKRYPTGIANAGDDNKSISDSGESSR